MQSGQFASDLKRYDEALASYDCALMLRQNLAQAHSNRGNALKELDRFDEALASYDRALAIRPDFADAHLVNERSIVSARAVMQNQDHSAKWRQNKDFRAGAF